MERAAPVVLALHGQPGDGGDFDALAVALGEDVRVIAHDRPGWGASAEPATGFAGNADAAAALLDGEGVGRAVVVGYSWGGGVALELARRHPERVAGLVLAASPGPGCPGPLDRALAAPVLGEVLVTGLFGVGRVVLRRDRLRRLVGGGVERLSRGDARRIGDGHLGLARTASFLAEQRALVDELPGLMRHPPAPDVPVRVVTGERDGIVTPEEARHLAAALPGARLTIVPAAGHLLTAPFVAALADTVRELLDLTGTDPPPRA